MKCLFISVVLCNFVVFVVCGRNNHPQMSDENDGRVYFLGNEMSNTPFSSPTPNSGRLYNMGTQMQAVTPETVTQSNSDFNNEELHLSQRNHNGNKKNRKVVHSSQNSFGNGSISITNFGFNLLKNLRNDPGQNVVVSPYSISILLALLQQGATGETQEEITKLLQMSPDASVVAFKQLLDDLQRRRNTNNVLNVANNIFLADSFNLNREFQQVAINYFGSELTPTNFRYVDKAVEDINQWVAAKTKNNIPQLVTKDKIYVDSKLFLANVVYFKGKWESKFRPESTYNQDFYLSNGNKKSVPFMHARRRFKCGMDYVNRAQLVVLPFEGNQYSLVVVLPSDTSNVNDVLSSLWHTSLIDYQTLSAKECQLNLPKFTIRADTDLSQVLKQMGVSKMFSEQSELFAIGTNGMYSPRISSALHSAMFSIDEKGGTAAAATGFGVVALSYDSPDYIVNVNRPFIAVLWDNQSSLPLFIGKVEDPSK